MASFAGKGRPLGGGTTRHRNVPELTDGFHLTLDLRTAAACPPPRRRDGKSGNGSRQSGIWVLDQGTRWQAMNWDYSGHPQKA
jgi:hypothetical protein